MSEEQSKTVIHLAHLTESSITEKSEDAIVIDTIFNSKNWLKECDLYSAIEAELGISVPKDRLKELLNKLNNEGKIEIDSTGFLQLSAQVSSNLNYLKARFIENEEKALQEWINDFVEKNNNYNEIYILDYKVAAKKFLKTLFVNHGVSSYNIIDGKHNHISFNTSEIAQSISEKYAEPMNMLLKECLPKLLGHPISTTRQQYLKSIIEKAISYLSAVVNSEISKKIIDDLKNLKIYLDTSVLYRLLNLQGSHRFETTKNIIDTLCKHGVTFFISSETFIELNSRIAYDAKIIVSHPIPCNLASLGYSFRSNDNYISAFWEARKNTKINAKDFNDKYKNTELLLNKLSVNIEKQPAIDNIKLLNDKELFFNKLSKFDKDKDK